MIFFNSRLKKLTDNEIKLVMQRRYGSEKSRGITKTYVFDIVLIKTTEIVGQCDLRLGNSWYLYYLGNIGYTIYIPFRGHHYATKASRLLIKLARDEGMKELVITCSPENIASYKTIIKIPAEYLYTIDVPKEHDLYRRNELRKCIFTVKL